MKAILQVTAGIIYIVAIVTLLWHHEALAAGMLLYGYLYGAITIKE
jgi:hypothetical protein